MEIITLLGQPADYVSPVLPAERLAQVTAIVTALTRIDTDLSDAVADSMALQVDNLRVDFSQNIAELQAEGTRQLRLLAYLTGIPLLFNKYTGKTETQTTGTYIYQVRG